MPGACDGNDRGTDAMAKGGVGAEPWIAASMALRISGSSMSGPSARMSSSISASAASLAAMAAADAGELGPGCDSTSPIVRSASPRPVR